MFLSILKSLLIVLACTANIHARLIISELYRDPPGGESELGAGASHEFIELINLGADTVRLDSLYLTNGLEADSIVPMRDTLPGDKLCRYNCRMLPPGAIAVLLDPDYRNSLTNSSSVRYSLPAGTILLECGDGAFGSSGLAVDHGVLLYRGTRSRIDTALCLAADVATIPPAPAGSRIVLSDPKNREGVSLEAVRILSDHPAFDYCETGTSPSSFAAIRDGWLLETTPGQYTRSPGTIGCAVNILSVGRHRPGPLGWRLESQRDGSWKTVATGSFVLSDDRGAANLNIPIDSLPHRIVLESGTEPSWPLDLSAAWVPENAIRITELFPRATTAEPEWFEIQNTSKMAISLTHWRFGNSTDTAALTGAGMLLEPGEFAIITKNAAAFSARYRTTGRIIEPPAWHALENSRDTLMLFDGTGIPRETVCYDDAWFSSWTSLSLERNGSADGCARSSWTVAQRATPGLPNTALFWRTASVPSLDIGPLPFTPDNDGIDDLLAIRLSLPAAATASIVLYGFDGRILKRFPGLPQEVVYWDGRSNSGMAPPGPFFVVAEVVEGSKTMRLRKKGILWRR